MVGRSASRLAAVLALCLCWAMPAAADDLDLPGVATDSDDLATSLSERHPAGGNDAERKQSEAAFNASLGKGDHDAFDLALQTGLESLLTRTRTRTLAGEPDRMNAAALIGDAAGHTLLAVASGYGTPGRSGGLDLTRAVRSPGLALKAMLYGLASRTAWHGRTRC